MAGRLLDDPQDPDDRARALVILGSVHEREGDWQAAVDCYAEAVAAAPQDPRVAYFAHNNLGYSLAQQGRFDEAALHCLDAIDVNPHQHNAHKNLGLARQGQGRWLDAALCFVTATRICPADPRARHLLDGLLASRPELAVGSEHLREEMMRMAHSGSESQQPA